MIVVKHFFINTKENKKRYNPKQVVSHFTEKFEKHLVKKGYAEFVKTDKKEKK